MKQYPRFLRSMPEFLGIIGFSDLGIILLSLWVCLILNIESYFALGASLLGIITLKIIKRNFDFVGFLSPKHKEMYLTDFRKEEE